MTVYGSLGKIAEDRWQAVADRFDLGRVTDATPLEQGLFGKNVELECGSGRWVFRGMHWDEVFWRERFFAQQIADRSSVGAAWPYHVDDSREIFAWTYAVMRHVGGEVVVLEREQDLRPVAAALGRAAAALHAVAFPTPASFSGRRLVGFDGSQREWFEARVAERLARIADTTPLDASSERLVATSLADAPVDGYEPTIVHHDLTVGNTRYVFSDDGVEVSGLFDLQECYVGDPDEDLARSLWVMASRGRPQAARTFLDAYRAIRPARPGESERLRAYVLADLLVVWEFGRREARDWFGGCDTFEDWASVILTHVDDVLGRGG